MPWKERPNVRHIERQNRELSFQLLRIREQLQIAERHRTGLKVMLTVREKRIDVLVHEVERLRAQNRRLDEENSRLTEMVRFTPPADAPMLAPTLETHATAI